MDTRAREPLILQPRVGETSLESLRMVSQPLKQRL